MCWWVHIKLFWSQKCQGRLKYQRNSFWTSLNVRGCQQPVLHGHSQIQKCSVFLFLLNAFCTSGLQSTLDNENGFCKPSKCSSLQFCQIFVSWLCVYVCVGSVSTQWDIVSLGRVYLKTWEVILAQTMASYIANLITAILVCGDCYLFYAFCTVSLLHVENQVLFIYRNKVEKIGFLLLRTCQFMLLNVMFFLPAIVFCSTNLWGKRHAASCGEEAACSLHWPQSVSWQPVLSPLPMAFPTAEFFPWGPIALGSGFTKSAKSLCSWGGF